MSLAWEVRKLFYQLEIKDAFIPESQQFYVLFL